MNQSVANSRAARNGDGGSGSIAHCSTVRVVCMHSSGESNLLIRIILCPALVNSNLDAYSYTSLSLEPDSSEKITKSRSEYRPCKYTESDEQLRMVSQQFFSVIQHYI
jgi:hypothetical protein